MFYYVPLEPLQERYTAQLAKPETGWVESNLRRNQIDYARIDGLVKYDNIKTGRILDAVNRSKYCFRQIEGILDLIDQGVIQTGDTIYFDDFWHPGIEAIPYLCDQVNIKPKMYAYLWAQSVDKYDFTYKMRGWIRPFETGIGSILNGVFVCCETLRDLVVQGGIAPFEKTHVVGLPVDISSVEKLMSKDRFEKPRENKVIFSSRWDEEKNPLFFLNVALEYIKKHGDDCKFVITTSAPKLRSSHDYLLAALKKTVESYPKNIVVKEGLSKQEYYDELTTAKVQFNCASQDFISFTLIEASIAGCYPLYPHYRSFPEVFKDHTEFMYLHGNEAQAVSRLYRILHSDNLWTASSIVNRAWIHDQYQDVYQKMFNTMRLLPTCKK